MGTINRPVGSIIRQCRIVRRRCQISRHRLIVSHWRKFRQQCLKNIHHIFQNHKRVAFMFKKKHAFSKAYRKQKRGAKKACFFMPSPNHEAIECRVIKKHAFSKPLNYSLGPRKKHAFFIKVLTTTYTPKYARHGDWFGLWSSSTPRSDRWVAESDSHLAVNRGVFIYMTYQIISWSRSARYCLPSSSNGGTI
jgi:hypothetical protein